MGFLRPARCRGTSSFYNWANSLAERAAVISITPIAPVVSLLSD
jgi:hypothetical protein